MKTDGNDVDINNQYVSRASSEGSEKQVLREKSFEQTSLDDISGIEHRLKALWSEFVEHQDKHGFDQKAKDLKEKYFKLYRSYRRNKNWKQIISNNQ